MTLGPSRGSQVLVGLGERLRALREAAGMSGAQLAGALGTGWRQSKISKIENGRQLPTIEEVRAWAIAAGADPRPLLALRAKTSARFGAWRDRIAEAGGGVALQEEIGALERAATRLGEYQPAFVPGLLQTPAYARGMLGAEDGVIEDGIPAAELGLVVAGKLRRQAILYESGREITHILGEAALRIRIGAVSVETMQGSSRTWPRWRPCQATTSASSPSGLLHPLPH